LGYCAMLTEEMSTPSDCSDFVDDLRCIAAAGQELLHLNGQAGDLIKIEQGNWQVSTTQVDVDEVLGDVIEKISARFPGYAFHLDGTAVIADTDLKAFGCLLAWVLTQLCKATSVPGTLTIRVSEIDDGCDIRIECQTPDPHEQRKLQRALERMLVPVRVLETIQDFDPYYGTTMSELARAELLPGPEELICHVQIKSKNTSPRR